MALKSLAKAVILTNLVMICSCKSEIEIEKIVLSQGPFYNTRSIEIDKNGTCYYSNERLNEINQNGQFLSYYKVQITKNDFVSLEALILDAKLAEFESDLSAYRPKPGQSQYSLKILLDGYNNHLKGANFPPNIQQVIDSIFALYDRKSIKTLVNKPHNYATFKDVYVPLDQHLFDSLNLPKIKKDSLE